MVIKALVLPLRNVTLLCSKTFLLASVCVQTLHVYQCVCVCVCATLTTKAVAFDLVALICFLH